jgi:hypothetical protein
MTVTYADNWKEDWIPASGTFSEAFNFSPVPQTLRGPAERWVRFSLRLRAFVRDEQMKTRGSYFFAALALIVAGVMVAVFSFRDDRSGVSSEAPPRVSVQQREQVAPRSDPAAASTASRNGASAPLSHDRTMASDFMSATDLRVFVESAKRAPERGGLFYAETAINECRFQIEDSIFEQARARISPRISRESDPKVQSRRLTAVDLLAGRCAQLYERRKSHRTRWLSWHGSPTPTRTRWRTAWLQASSTDDFEPGRVSPRAAPC